MAEQALVIDPKDSVAVALADLPAGQQCAVRVGDDTLKVELREKIPFGHKFALFKIRKGERVLKYGEVIGEATHDIEPGAWVHVHNLVSRRGRGHSEAGVQK
ncbi:MAG: UxaA family hydrolase [Sphingomonadaceae bacterium]